MRGVNLLPPDRTPFKHNHWAKSWRCTPQKAASRGRETRRRSSILGVERRPATARRGAPSARFSYSPRSMLLGTQLSLETLLITLLRKVRIFLTLQPRMESANGRVLDPAGRVDRSCAADCVAQASPVVGAPGIVPEGLTGTKCIIACVAFPRLYSFPSSSDKLRGGNCKRETTAGSSASDYESTLRRLPFRGLPIRTSVQRRYWPLLCR